MISQIAKLLCVAALIQRASSRRSLTRKGIVAAGVTGIVHASHPSFLPLALLLAFYISGTALTRYKASVKATLTVSQAHDTSSGPAPRNHIQVLANSVTASVLILSHMVWPHDRILFAVIAHYAAVTSDTWSSEVGILAQSPPILITTLRPCPKGTNGGISNLGLGVAILGGFYIGLVGLLCAPLSLSLPQGLRLLGLTTFFGVFGSLLDSLLGALFQRSAVNAEGKIIECPGRLKSVPQASREANAFSLDLLSNNGINLAMTSLTTLLALISY